MAKFDMAEAKAHFSELIQRAMRGEEVIVSKGNRPVVKMVPVQPARRKPGTGKGVWMAPDFDASLEDLADYM